MKLRTETIVGVLLAGCLKHPTTSLPYGDKSPSGADPAAELPMRAPRKGDPDPQVVQTAVEAALKIPVVVLGRQPMRTDGPPHLDFIVFKADGEVWCSSYLPLEQRNECVAQEGVTWSMRQVLGVAVVAFEDPAKPYVSKYRFLGSSSLIPSGNELPGDYDSGGANHASLTRIELGEIFADDVDEDGQQEVVVRVSHGSLTGNVEEGPNAVYENFWHKRLLVFRADLSLQADGYVHQIWDSSSPAWAMDDHRLNEKYTFENNAIVLEWCEVWYGAEDCPPDVVCKGPTERVTVGYDREKDNYSRVQRERIRSPIGDVEWKGDTCLEEPR